MYIYLYIFITMIGFLRRCCDGSQYKIVQRLEDLFERLEAAIGGVDLPKLITNINMIAQHLTAANNHQQSLPAPQSDTTQPTIVSAEDEKKVDTATGQNISQIESGPSLIDAFFAGKEQVIKDEIREYMLANYNITALDDQLEGKMYDYMVDAIWHLAIKKYIPQI